MGPVAYRLRLPDGWDIHNVFYMSYQQLLKSVVGNVERKYEFEVESGTDYEIVPVAGIRVVRWFK